MMKGNSWFKIIVLFTALLILVMLPWSIFAETLSEETAPKELSPTPVDPFAVEQNTASANSTIAVQEVIVSDTEEFIRWHSTAFGTAWYHYNSVMSVIQAADGSYVSTGYSSPAQNKQMVQHAYVTKFNKNGSIAWDKVFGGGTNGEDTITPNANFCFSKVIQLANGDFLAVGQTDDALGLAANGYQSIFAVRITNGGNVLWQKAYGLSGKETHTYAWDAAENSDGSISIFGNYRSKYNNYDRGYPGMIELVVDADGALQNSYSVTDDFGPEWTIDSTSCSMKRTADGGYIAQQNAFASVWSDGIAKLSADGTREWGLRLFAHVGDHDSQMSNSKIIVLPDGYIIAGITPIIGDNETIESLMVYKLDLNGNLLWTKLLQNITLNNNISDVQAYQTPENDVLLAVQNGYSTTDFTVVKMSSDNGNVNWVKSYGTKTGFDRNYGGSTYMTLLANNSDQLLGLGGTFITKFGGDGSLAFSTDEFTIQNRTGYSVSDIDTTRFEGGAFIKFAHEANAVVEKDLSMLTTLSSHDIRAVVAEAEVTGVTLSESQKNVGVGATFDLTATVQPDTAPNKAVSWSSDNETVASVDSNGRVTTYQAGTATITVTTVVGSKTASCVVTVTDSVESPDIYYQTHVQNVGWQDWKMNGDMSGTSGRSLRLEGIYIVVYPGSYDLGVAYQTHVQNIGWQDWRSDGEMSGTSGLSLRLEGICMYLTGSDSELFDIYYQVHAQNFGWLDWAKNGEDSGTAGFGYRLEGIRIVIVPKGSPAPGPTDIPFVQN